MVKGGFLIISATLAWGPVPDAWGQSQPGPAAGANVMRIDSIIGFTGQLVNIPIRLTNDRSIAGLDMRLSYDALAESLHSVTRGERVADWEFFDAVSGTGSGEIHIVGFSEPLPVDTANPIVMPAGSGTVAYLNFKIYDQPIFVGSFTEVNFVFPDTLDNVMYDSAGNLVGQNEITYVNGGIDLRTTGVSDRTGNRPGEFRLGQNFPNPFNPQTAIEFYLPASGHTNLTIYDVLGRTVFRLVDKDLPAGAHSAVWGGRDAGGFPVSSGVYFYRLASGSFHQTKKMILAK